MKLSYRFGENDCCFDSEIIEELKQLEAKAANWDMLEKLPTFTDVRHVDNVRWKVNNMFKGAFEGATAAEALRKFWEDADAREENAILDEQESQEFGDS